MPSLVINQRQIEGITVLDCAGRISLGEGSVLLRNVLQEKCRRPNPKSC